MCVFLMPHVLCAFCREPFYFQRVYYSATFNSFFLPFQKLSCFVTNFSYTKQKQKQTHFLCFLLSHVWFFLCFCFCSVFMFFFKVLSLASKFETTYEHVWDSEGSWYYAIWLEDSGAGMSNSAQFWTHGTYIYNYNNNRTIFSASQLMFFFMNHAFLFHCMLHMKMGWT